MRLVVHIGRVPVVLTAAILALLASLAMATPSVAQRHPQLASAPPLIERLYIEHELMRAAGTSLVDVPLLAKAYLFDEITDLLPQAVGSFDVLYSAPDHQIHAPSMQVLGERRSKRGRRLVTALVSSGRERAELVFVLDREHGQWQVRDIIGPDWQLSQMLASVVD